MSVSGTAQGTAADSSMSVPGYGNSQSTGSQGFDSRYGSDASSGYRATSGSRYLSNLNSASYSAADSRYSATSGAGSYASGGYNAPDTRSSGSAGDGRAGYNRYRNGQFSDSQDDNDWNPGDTGYVPGQTGYQPGHTGYQPPGTSPYPSPSGYSTQSPYLPGSTKPYSPQKPNDSALERSDSAAPRTDSHVIPAGHTRL
jgi:serine/threonine-protein kinase